MLLPFCFVGLQFSRHRLHRARNCCHHPWSYHRLHQNRCCLLSILKNRLKSPMEDYTANYSDFSSPCHHLFARHPASFGASRSPVAAAATDPRTWKPRRYLRHSWQHPKCSQICRKKLQIDMIHLLDSSKSWPILQQEHGIWNCKKKTNRWQRCHNESLFQVSQDVIKW